MISIDNAGIFNAFAAGQQGLQSANKGITQAASNIAERTVQNAQNTPVSDQNTSNAAEPVAQGSVTDDLIALNVNSLNAQASAKVLDVANETLGSIIDTLA